MKKLILILTICGMISTTLLGCSNDVSQSDSDGVSSNSSVSTPKPEDSSTTSVSDEKPIDSMDKEIIFIDYNGSDDFKFKIKLLDGWTIKEREGSTEPAWSKKFPLDGLQSIHNIYDDNGEYIGAIGYNTYEEYEGAETNPEAIYSGVALPNGYNFSARLHANDGYYNPIEETDSGVTAVTKVYSAPYISEGAGLGRVAIYNKGILSYNKDLLVYIAIELDDNALNDEELKGVAHGIVVE